jgi:hypothetical protein
MRPAARQEPGLGRDQRALWPLLPLCGPVAGTKGGREGGREGGLQGTLWCSLVSFLVVRLD